MAQDRNILNILPQLVSKGLFNESVSAMDIFDLDYFENRIRELQSAFFEDFITHTLALKANPIRGIVMDRSFHFGFKNLNQEMGRAHFPLGFGHFRQFS